MLNLKAYLDAARDADNEVKRVANEIDTLFIDGTEESRKKALELRPALDEARNNAKEANDLYISMRDASLVTDNAASLFTAPADPAATPEESNAPKVMNRAAYDKLSPVERAEFIVSGGKVVDE